MEPLFGIHLQPVHQWREAVNDGQMNKKAAIRIAAFLLAHSLRLWKMAVLFRRLFRWLFRWRFAAVALRLIFRRRRGLAAFRASAIAAR